MKFFNSSHVLVMFTVLVSLSVIVSSYTLIGDVDPHLDVPGPVMHSSSRRQMEAQYRNRSRDGRLFNFLNLIKFDNYACNSSDSIASIGTCYTAKECSLLGGQSSGKCAAGYGVCCVFSRSCGENSIANNTYFINPTGNRGNQLQQCQLTVRRKHPNVCQYRLEFETFNIAGPDIVTEGRVGDCVNDMFIVTAAGGTTPVVCGDNSGQHMYVSLGSTSDSAVLTMITSSLQPTWTIRIVQIPCNSNYMAPSGCLQYYTGVSGVVKSFNYDGRDHHLNNQRYSICIRTESGFCGITWKQVADSNINTNVPGQVLESFQISAITQTGTAQDARVGTDVLSTAQGGGQILCTGQSGQTDFIEIPCGSIDGRAWFTAIPPGVGGTTGPIQQCSDKFCGTLFGYTSNSDVAQSVVSLVQPFVVHVRFDDREATLQAAQGNTPAVFEPGYGFYLQYTQMSCVG